MYHCKFWRCIRIIYENEDSQPKNTLTCKYIFVKKKK